jgi:hypothetical protein
MVKNVHHVGIPSEFREDMGASTVVIEFVYNVKVLHFDMIRFFNRLFDYNVVMIVGTKGRSIFFQFFDLRRSGAEFTRENRPTVDSCRGGVPEGHQCWNLFEEVGRGFY